MTLAWILIVDDEDYRIVFAPRGMGQRGEGVKEGDGNAEA
jgi:hypothetical protein